MSLWLTIIGSAFITVLIYYAFKNYSLQKALLVALTSATLICYAFISILEFPQQPFKNKPNAPISDKYSWPVGEKLMKTEFSWNKIHKNDVELFQIKSKAWSDGNNLWILSGKIKNNSNQTINAIELEIKLNDCGPNDKMNDICDHLDRHIIEIVKELNIPTHNNGEFTTTYAIKDASHNYKLNLLPSRIATSYTYIIEPRQYFYEDKDNNNIRENLISLSRNYGVDKTPTCGGGGSYHKEDNHNIMLAGKEFIGQLSSTGC